jgi:site-specific recombinase XerD
MNTATQNPLPTAVTDSTVQLVELAEKAHGFYDAATAPATRLARHKDWTDFERWCASHGVETLPADPATVILYITDLAERLKVSTIARRLSSISVIHEQAGLTSPTKDERVKGVLKGIRRTLGVATREASPLTIAEIRKICYSLGTGMLDVRDRALLLVGFAGALRRSELVALTVEDLAWRAEGIVAVIRRSKTDQEGEGRRVALPYGNDPATCPVRSIEGWLAISGITSGALFRSVNRHGHIADTGLSDQSVALVIKRRVAAVGLDPTRHSGHSTRAGFCTSAAMAGSSERAIAAQSGHRSVHVLRRYIRIGGAFTDNAVTELGM